MAALLLAAALPVSAQQDRSGLYRAADGHRIVVFPAPPNPASTAMLELATGEVRMLFPREEGGSEAFTFGPALAVPEPVTGTLLFARDDAGGVTGFVRQDAEAAPVRFERARGRREPVAFANGSVRLAGTLLVPEGLGPFPAVVMLHGSEPEPREGNLGMALFLVSEGFAALVFDKRGVGESKGGDWRASLDAYAGDACAAFEAIRAQPGIDARRSGYWGHSQGAWVAALAAVRTQDAAFAVLECGGALDPVETTLWSTRRLLESTTSFTPDEIEALLEYRRRKFDVVAGRLTRAELEPYTAEARKQPWFARVTERLPDGPFWEANAGYDPRPALEGLGHCAVLALYAEHDDLTPTEPSVRAARAAFERAGHERAAVHVIPAANHGLFETRTGKRMQEELPTLQRFAPGYATLLIGWLKDVTGK